LSKAVIPGRHLVGLESPTYSKGKFQESAGLASKIRQFYHNKTFVDWVRRSFPD
jgi:hypothetical protein